MADNAEQGFKTLFQTQLTDVKTADQGDAEGVGVLRQEGDRFYRWVKNSESKALLAGQPVVYSIGNAATYHKAVKIPVSADLNTLAGIVQGAIPALGFGWVQIEGYYGSCIMSYGKTDVSVGVNMFPADTVSYLIQASVDQMSLTVGSVDNQMAGRVQLAESVGSSSGSAAGSDAASTAVGGWIHCLNV